MRDVALDNPHVRRELLSQRYAADGKPVARLTQAQKAGITRFRDAVARGKLTYEDVPACLLCGETEQPVISEKDNQGLPHLLVCCPGCGFIYAVRRLDGESLGSYYSTFYRDMNEGETTPAIVDARFAEARAVMAAAQAKMVAALGLKRDDTVVELGAGGGWNLAPIADAGFRAIGFDYDPKFIAYGRERGIEMHNLVETSPDKVVPEGAALVVVREVVEHVADPFTFLAEINSYLRPDGYLYLTAPSLAEIPFGYAAGDPLEEFQIPHLYLFDEFTLPAFLEMAGFRLRSQRADLKLIAQRVAKPARVQHRIPGNYARAMRRLRFAETIARHLWSTLYRRILGRNYRRYFKLTRLVALTLSGSRRATFLERRRRTGL